MSAPEKRRVAFGPDPESDDPPAYSDDDHDETTATGDLLTSGDEDESRHVGDSKPVRRRKEPDLGMEFTRWREVR